MIFVKFRGIRDNTCNLQHNILTFTLLVVDVARKLPTIKKAAKRPFLFEMIRLIDKQCAIVIEIQTPPIMDFMRIEIIGKHYFSAQCVDAIANRKWNRQASIF